MLPDLVPPQDLTTPSALSTLLRELILFAQTEHGENLPEAGGAIPDSSKITEKSKMLTYLINSDIILSAIEL